MAEESDNEGIGEFQLKIVGKHEIARLRFPNFPKNRPMKTSKSFRLVDLIGRYKGPDIIFDFDQTETFVGVEVLADD